MDTAYRKQRGGVWYLGLDGGRSLGAQHLDGLEDVHHSLVPHPLQHDAERDEHARSAHASAARSKETIR